MELVCPEFMSMFREKKLMWNINPSDYELLDLTRLILLFFFFFIIPPPPEFSLLPLHDAFPISFPYDQPVQTMKAVRSQQPAAICDLDPTMVAFNFMVTRDTPPFNDPDLRVVAVHHEVEGD